VRSVILRAERHPARSRRIHPCDCASPGWRARRPRRGWILRLRAGWRLAAAGSRL